MDLSGNPWVIFPGDVPGTGYLEVRAAHEPVFIDSIVWEGYGATTDIVDVKDGRDRELFFKKGETNTPTLQQSFYARTPVYGLRVYTLTAGQLYVFLR